MVMGSGFRKEAPNEGLGGVCFLAVRCGIAEYRMSCVRIIFCVSARNGS